MQHLVELESRCGLDFRQWHLVTLEPPRSEPFDAELIDDVLPTQNESEKPKTFVAAASIDDADNFEEAESRSPFLLRSGE